MKENRIINVGVHCSHSKYFFLKCLPRWGVCVCVSVYWVMMQNVFPDVGYSLTNLKALGRNGCGLFSTTQIWTLPASGFACCPDPPGQDGDVMCVCSESFAFYQKQKLGVCPKGKFQEPKTWLSLVVQRFNFPVVRTMSVLALLSPFIFWVFSNILGHFYGFRPVHWPASWPQEAHHRDLWLKLPHGGHLLTSFILWLSASGSLDHLQFPNFFFMEKAIYSICWRLHSVPLSCFWYT